MTLLFTVWVIAWLNDLTEGFHGFDSELSGFIKNYKTTNIWWIDSFLVSIISLTIGSSPGFRVDLIVLSLFFAPAMVHFVQNYPFSLSCEYRPSEVGHEEKGIALPDGDEYAVTLDMRTGSNIDLYQLRVDHPSGVALRNISPPPSGAELDDERNIITGDFPSDDRRFSLDIIFEITNGIPPGGSSVEISDVDSGRNLTEIHLLP